MLATIQDQTHNIFKLYGIIAYPSNCSDYRGPFISMISSDEREMTLLFDVLRILFGPGR